MIDLLRSINALSSDRELGVTILDKENSPLPPLQAYMTEMVYSMDGIEDDFRNAVMKGEDLVNVEN